MENMETEYPHYFETHKTLLLKWENNSKCWCVLGKKKKKNEHETSEKQTEPSATSPAVRLRTELHSLGGQGGSPQASWAPSGVCLAPTSVMRRQAGSPVSLIGPRGLTHLPFPSSPFPLSPFPSSPPPTVGVDLECPRPGRGVNWGCRGNPACLPEVAGGPTHRWNDD